MIHRFKSEDCPDADGKQVPIGTSKWCLSFPLEGGDDYLEIEIGERGRNALLAMLAQEEADDALEASMSRDRPEAGANGVDKPPESRAGIPGSFPGRDHEASQLCDICGNWGGPFQGRVETGHHRMCARHPANNPRT